MRAKVCYTLLPKLYHKCKPIATNRRRFFRGDLALRAPIGAAQKSDRSHDSSRVQGELRSALRHTLDPAAPTTCDRDSVHRLPTLAQAHSARDDEDSAPPSPPTLNSTRNVRSAQESMKRSREVSFPFEAVIARNAIPDRGSSAIVHFSRRKPVDVAHSASGSVRPTDSEGGRVPNGPLSPKGDLGQGLAEVAIPAIQSVDFEKCITACQQRWLPSFPR